MPLTCNPSDVGQPRVGGFNLCATFSHLEAARVSREMSLPLRFSLATYDAHRAVALPLDSCCPPAHWPPARWPQMHPQTTRGGQRACRTDEAADEQGFPEPSWGQTNGSQRSSQRLTADCELADPSWPLAGSLAHYSARWFGSARLIKIDNSWSAQIEAPSRSREAGSPTAPGPGHWPSTNKLFRLLSSRASQSRANNKGK